jgi:hypothetical protein
MQDSDRKIEAVQPDEEKSHRTSGVTISWRTSVLIIVLTLFVWVVFQQAGQSLDKPSTAFVALCVTILVAAGEFLWSRTR